MYVRMCMHMSDCVKPVKVQPVRISVLKRILDAAHTFAGLARAVGIPIRGLSPEVCLPTCVHSVHMHVNKQGHVRMQQKLFAPAWVQSM